MKKRYMLFIMIILMFSVLIACGNLVNESSESSIANVGDVLDKPEKTMSLESIDEITVDSIAQNDEIEYSFLISVDYDGENTRYYDKLRYRSEDGQININENLSLPGQNGRIDYQRFDISDVFMVYENSLEEAYRRTLAVFGIDYGDYFKFEGFIKQEDAQLLGKSCFVYKTKKKITSDANMSESDIVEMTIYVDKETGLWLKTEERRDKGNFVRTVSNVEYNSNIIPCLKTVEMKEQVVYSKNGIEITAKALDCYDPNAAVLLLETKNNNNKDIRFKSHYFNINGLSMGGGVLEDVCPAGKTKQTTLKMANYDTYKLCNIEIIQSIEFALEIVYANSNNSIIEKSTGPLSIKTECPVDYVQAVDKKGTVLINTDDVYFVLNSFEVDDGGRGIFKTYSENKLGEVIRTTLKIKNINGIEFTNYLYQSEKITTQENSMGFGGFVIPYEILKEMGIETITSVSLTHEVFCGDSIAQSTRITEESELITIEFN